MKEEWRHIKIEPFCNYYLVSNLGRVMSLSRNRVMKAYSNKATGYLTVSLSHQGHHKTVPIHRLVALAFVDNPNPEKYNTINHKDENKHNNNARNLEWCTQKYNVNYGTAMRRASITSKYLHPSNKTIPITVFTDDGWCKRYNSIRQAAEGLSLNKSAISSRLERPDVYGDEIRGYHFIYASDKRVNSKHLKGELLNKGLTASNHRTTEEEFKKKLNNKFGGSLSYVSGLKTTHEKCLIKCNNCGLEFEATPLNLITGSKYGCPECALNNRAAKRTFSLRDSQERLDKITNHNLKITGGYQSASQKCLLECKHCGHTFESTIVNLLYKKNGNGCPKCNKSRAMMIRNYKRYRGQEWLDSHIEEINAEFGIASSTTSIER